MKHLRIIVVVTSLYLPLLAQGGVTGDPKVALGRAIFMDSSLSEPAGQACAGCHRPEQAFADPGKVVSAGANPTLSGNRNAPSISYVRFNPTPVWNAEDETWIGGFFLDGRAQTLREQAGGPFLNPLEMANPDAAAVIKKLKRRPYAADFSKIYGTGIWGDTEKAFAAIADALATYESKGEEFAPFTSRYDAYLRGESTLTAEELRGLELFEDEKKGNCAACHPSKKNDDGSMPLFTDFSYDNIGLPQNKKLPFLAMDKKYNPDGQRYTDPGLGATHYANKQDERGKFKVPSLRNVERTMPYMHNGVFETLREAVEFYNTRDVDKKWDKPEIDSNVNRDELGDLKLTEKDIDDIVAFLKTLSDRHER